MKKLLHKFQQVYSLKAIISLHTLLLRGNPYKQHLACTPAVLVRFDFVCLLPVFVMFLIMRPYDNCPVTCFDI